MAAPPLPDVLEAAKVRVRARVLEHFSPDSCVATTRITIDVLRYFGIQAKAVAVTVIALNGDAYELLEAGSTPHDIWVASQPWGPQDPGGPWTLGLGFAGPGEEEAAGHVVAWVPAGEAFLDLSLDQVSRPLKAMTMQPEVFSLLPGEDPTDPEWTGVFAIPQDRPARPAVLLYQSDPRALYRSSPNWRRKGRGEASGAFREATGSAISDIRIDLGA